MSDNQSPFIQSDLTSPTRCHRLERFLANQLPIGPRLLTGRLETPVENVPRVAVIQDQQLVFGPTVLKLVNNVFLQPQVLRGRRSLS